MVLSQMLCSSCLAEMVPHVHTVHFYVEPQAAELVWLHMRIVSESGEMWGKKRAESPHLFASDFMSLRAFVIGRTKRPEEINLPMSECVRKVCDLMSDVLTDGWNKKVLRATGYSVRSAGNDDFVSIL